MTPAPFYRDDLVTIYNADCRAPEFRDVLLDAAVMVTDPPYGIAWESTAYNEWRGGADGSAGRSIANDSDTAARDDIPERWGSARPAVVFGSPKLPPPAGTKQVLVWHKPLPAGFTGVVNGWFRNWEAVYLLGTWPRLPAQRDSIIRVAEHPYKGVRETGHSHAKPIALMRALIETCPPAVIVDPFMGSGSTLRAAMELGRQCIGFDVEPGWCAVARDRMAQGALFSAGGAS